jgi:hypothetical protein
MAYSQQARLVRINNFQPNRRDTILKAPQEPSDEYLDLISIEDSGKIRRRTLIAGQFAPSPLQTRPTAEQI